MLSESPWCLGSLRDDSDEAQAPQAPQAPVERPRDFRAEARSRAQARRRDEEDMRLGLMSFFSPRNGWWCFYVSLEQRDTLRVWFYKASESVSSLHWKLNLVVLLTQKLELFPQVSDVGLPRFGGCEFLSLIVRWGPNFVAILNQITAEAMACRHNCSRKCW
jgi:hypothetical protein